MECFEFTYNGVSIKVLPQDCRPGASFKLPIGWPRDEAAEAALVSRGVAVKAAEVDVCAGDECESTTETRMQVILLFGTN